MSATPTEHFRASCPSCRRVYRVATTHRGSPVRCLKCGRQWRPGQADAAARDSRVGEVLSNYELIRLLGRGEGGEVYEALDRVLERKVAIKLLPASRAADPAVLQNLILEAREAARLQHPNVLTIQHIGAHQGTYYVVSELVDGGSAGDYLIAHGKMDPVEAGRVVSDAARALAAAHRLGIVHRNLKPSNILCGKDGVVKVADFGLERRGGGAGHSIAGRSVGAALFMSPEHFRNDLLDPRSDVYSLGCVYYALLTGRPPFPANSLVQAARRHLLSPVPDPRRVRPSLSDQTARIVMKCLAKEPDARYAGMEELLADLEAAGLTTTSTASLDTDSIRWTDFIAAVTDPNEDSMDLLPELGPRPMIAPQRPAAPAGESAPSATAVASATDDSPDPADSGEPFGWAELSETDLAALPEAGKPPSGLVPAVPPTGSTGPATSSASPASAINLAAAPGLGSGSKPSLRRLTAAWVAAPQPSRFVGWLPGIIVAAVLSGLLLAILLRPLPNKPPPPAPPPSGIIEPENDVPEPVGERRITAELERRLADLADLADTRDWKPEPLADLIRQYQEVLPLVRGTRYEEDVQQRLHRLDTLQEELLRKHKDQKDQPKEQPKDHKDHKDRKDHRPKDKADGPQPKG